MDCLYQTTTKYTLEEYKRFTRTLLKKRTFILVPLLEVLLILMGLLLRNIFLIVFAVIYPFLTAWVQNRQIKKVYFSNKVTQNAEVCFSFYDTYFTETNASGDTRLTYSQLHKVIETKTNVYLMIAQNQGFILNKANFPEGLANFLKGIKPEG